MVLPLACYYLENVVISQLIVFLYHNFLWWSCSFSRLLKIPLCSIEKCTLNGVSCLAIQSFPVFLKVTISCLPFHALVSPCSVLVLYITGYRIQFLKLASLKSATLEKLNTLMILCVCSAGFYIIIVGFLLLTFKNYSSVLRAENHTKPAANHSCSGSSSAAATSLYGLSFVTPSEHCPVV